MQPVLTAAAMREADRSAIEDYGIPGFTLMETAGRGAVEEMERRYGSLSGRTVACFCGKGNNGGDGLVVARVLYSRGAVLKVYTLGDEGRMSPDAAHNLQLLRHLAEYDVEGRLHLAQLDAPGALENAEQAEFFVDALLGTGLTSAPRAPFDTLIAWMNEHPQPTVALDIPTGLHTDTGTAPGQVVEADLTVTMGALKTGLLLNDGPRYAGTVRTVEIGIPAFILRREAGQVGCAWRPTETDMKAWWPVRAHDAHKYSAGLTLIVAGAPGYTGAPVMAATAAARVGSGYVVCACPEPVRPLLAAKLTEIPTFALPDGPAGGLDPEAALEALAVQVSRARALLVGPGLGQQPETQRFVRSLLAQTNLPAVIDADGLNALVGHTDMLTRQAHGRWILTPHTGEFKRLAGEEVDLADRVRTAQRFAAQWKCVVVLKGLPSVVGCPDGTAYINPTGNPALATAGTGDVLAGMCAGLLAQGCSAAQAAVCALYAGGAAADRYAGHAHGSTMMATDLLDELPGVLRSTLER